MSAALFSHLVYTSRIYAKYERDFSVTWAAKRSAILSHVHSPLDIPYKSHVSAVVIHDHEFDPSFAIFFLLLLVCISCKITVK